MVKLPNLKNRVDLVLSDYDDDRPGNDIQASGVDDFVEQNRFSLALRWRSSPESGLSHRIGVGRRLQPFFKSRYRNSHLLTNQTILRWETSAYMYSDDGLGADFSWQLGYIPLPNNQYIDGIIIFISETGPTIGSGNIAYKSLLNLMKKTH